LKAVRLIALSLVLALMIFPLLWMFRVSLMPPGAGLSLEELISPALSLLPYQDILTSGKMALFFFNSLLVGVVVTVANILFCFLSGYAFARHPFPGRRFWFYSVLFVLMIPSHIVIVPLYIMLHKLGMYDTYWALILPFAVNPIGIFLVRQYLETLPTSMEEAARIDGASELQIIFKVVMPLCKPALAVLAIQVFLTNWNSFLFPLIFTSSESVRTLPVALALYQGHQAIDWSHLMAGSSLAVIPVLAVFLVFQRQIVSGITAGAVRQ